MSKPSATRGWVCALCTVPVLSAIAIALLVFSPVRRHSALPTHAPATPAARARVQASYASLPLAFEENQGQTDAQVKYMARGNGYTLFLTAKDAVFSLRTPSAESKNSDVRRGAQLRTKGLPAQRNTQKDSSAAVRMQLTGANSLARISASGQLPGRSNYFIGNDPSQWQTDVAHYARVSYQDVYPGINLAFHGAQRQTEFDFVVAPGANPAPIAFQFTGAQGMKTDDSGNLVISSTAGNVLLHKPFAYQERNGARQPVDARFILKANNQVSFELGNYDRTRELVIDPSVSYAYSTYLGGSAEDIGEAITFDNSGDAYVTGQTASTNFPGASGTNKLTGAANVFVTRFNAGGSSLVYSTYVGGSGTDSGNSIAVNSSDVAFVAGSTTSADFPTTTGAFQTKLGTGAQSNAVIFELSAGGAITYSTYLGGTGNDAALGIALDSTSGAYAVVGRTSSSNFPTHNALQSALAGTSNGFVSLWNSTGNALVYSTYLGGGTGDVVGAVALDSSDNAYLTGEALSANFPTKNPFQSKCGSCGSNVSDAFVTVINPTGSAYVYSTFLGGSGADVGDAIAVDSAGNAYVTGLTGSSTDFPLKSPLQPNYGGGTNDAFVTKFNSNGSALLYSTFLGGSAGDLGASITVDGFNNVYITGQTNSNDFPTVNPTQSAFGGGDTDAFVSEINAAGSALAFSTYLGGSGDEDENSTNYGGIAVDSAGANIYVTGNTNSTDFPTHSPYQANNGGGGNTDVFVVKYAQTGASGPTFSYTATALSPSSVSPGASATSTVTVTAANGFSGSVVLTCSISGPSGAVHPPTCGAASASSGTPATLTVSTTAATALLQPSNDHSRGLFYAMLLPIGGALLLGIGSADWRRKKLFGFLLLGLLLSSLLLMPACGGSSGGGGGGGGSAGTTAGTYTITVLGTSTGGTQTGPSPSLTLTVN